ncbi:hypothetical protein MAHJHV55_54210 [Mycobacterium avium subsp. hominissuis]
MTGSPAPDVDLDSGQPWEVVVERGKIAEFAEAMLSDDPAYRGPGGAHRAALVRNVGGMIAPGPR